MQMAAFNARCPYEIGDKIRVAIPAEKTVPGQMYSLNPDKGQLFSLQTATITDIACTHYVKSGKIVFTYELNNSGQYAPLMDLKDAVKRD